MTNIQLSFMYYLVDICEFMVYYVEVKGLSPLLLELSGGLIIKVKINRWQLDNDSIRWHLLGLIGFE